MGSWVNLRHFPLFFVHAGSLFWRDVTAHSCYAEKSQRAAGWGGATVGKSGFEGISPQTRYIRSYIRYLAPQKSDTFKATFPTGARTSSGALFSIKSECPGGCPPSACWNVLFYTIAAGERIFSCDRCNSYTNISGFAGEESDCWPQPVETASASFQSRIWCLCLRMHQWAAARAISKPN